MLSDTEWVPPGNKWRKALNKAMAADPNNPVLHVEVCGVGTDLAKGDPYRKTLSQIVQVDVNP